MRFSDLVANVYSLDLAAVTTALLFVAVQTSTAQFVVNEPSDLPDFDIDDGMCTVCFLVDDDGNCVTPGGCTLVAAIENANLNADVTQILFTVPEVHSPIPTTAFPEIIFPVLLNSDNGDLVSIRGPGPTENSPGLLFSGHASDGSEVHSLDISGYPNGIEFRNSSFGVVEGCYIFNNQIGGNGILVSGTSEDVRIGGLTSDPGVKPGNIIAGNSTGIRLIGSGGHLIYGNDIGFDDVGQPSGNSTGIFVGIGAGEGTDIGGGDPGLRNVISNSQFNGVSVSGTGFGENDPVSGLRIIGNYFGLDRDGTFGFGNLRGITLTRTEGIEIGGVAEGDGNTFASNGDGIWLNNNANNTQVIGNIIGLVAPNADSTGNLNGIVVRANANDNLIQSNVISGNVDDGIVVTEVSGLIPSRNAIELNFIGFNGSGLDDDIGNGGNGISIVDAESTSVGLNYIGANGGYGIFAEGPGTTDLFILENMIGLETSASDSSGNGAGGVLLSDLNGAQVVGNLIGHNKGAGLQMTGITATVVKKNWIGASDDTRFDVGNEGNGVLINGESSDDLIGGEDAEDGNQISFNNTGVHVVSGLRNEISRNRMVGNEGPGIDIGAPGIQINDFGDGDSGANNLQNFPALVSAVGDNISSIFVTFEVQSSTSASTYPIRLEFFVSDIGDAEGAIYIGSVLYEGANAEQQVTSAFEVEKEVLDGDFIVATATDADGNTSEFSGTIMVTGGAIPVAIGEIPEPNFDLSLFEPYPNPFSSTVVIRYEKPQSDPSSLEIFDILGRRVLKTELSSDESTGRIEWDGTGEGGHSLSAGVYFVRLTSGTSASATRKIVYTR